MINKKIEEQAILFAALGHPVRLAIARGLLRRSCNVKKIVAGLDLPQSTVSQHLRVLSQARIIKGEREGVRICYQISDSTVRRLLSLIK